MRYLVALTMFAAGVLAQSGAYGQCGGTGWTGATTCVSGYVCTYSSEYYSQCLPGTATTSAASTTLATSTTPGVSSTAKTSSAAATATSTGKFKWFGVDESGAEFGTGTYPGTWGIDFIFPDNSSLQVCSQYPQDLCCLVYDLISKLDIDWPRIQHFPGTLCHGTYAFRGEPY